MQRCEFDLKLGEMPFYGARGGYLGHIVSNKGIEVDKAKVEVIEKFPPPTSLKGVRSFLGHIGFYRWFIKDFSKIAKPLAQLLVKDVALEFNEECLSDFHLLKEALITTPIMQALDWELPFAVMCDASDYAVGVFLGQRKGNKPYAICYANRIVNEAQINYAMTEKEFLAVVFTLEKFRSYFINSKVIVFTDHATLKHLMMKSNSKPRLI